MAKIDLKTSSFSVLKALAMAIAAEMDGGDLSNADLLEEVFIHLPKAK